MPWNYPQLHLTDLDSVIGHPTILPTKSGWLAEYM